MANAYGVKVTHVGFAQVAGHLIAGVPNGISIELYANPERDPFWQNLYLERPQIAHGYLQFTKAPGAGPNSQ